MGLTVSATYQAYEKKKSGIVPTTNLQDGLRKPDGEVVTIPMRPTSENFIVVPRYPQIQQKLGTPINFNKVVFSNAKGDSIHTVIYDEAHSTVDTMRYTDNLKVNGVDKGTGSLKTFLSKDGKGLIMQTVKNGKVVSAIEYREDMVAPKPMDVAAPHTDMQLHKPTKIDLGPY